MPQIDLGRVVGPQGAQGETGPYFTPAVDADGNISWTNNGGLVNPTTQNIKGETGETGATPELSIGTVTTLDAGEDATVTITGTDEAPVLNFGIPKGDTGEVTEAELQTTLEDYAKVDGYYEGLVSGGATQMITDATVNDQRPYLLRASGGGLSIGTWEKDAVVGATLAWNQLAPDSYALVTIPSGRKYVSYINGVWSLGVSDGTTIAVDGSLGDMLTDLTAMFGSTIADRAYALEQAEAGSGIAWLQSYGFFTEDYYAYNAGELMSVNVSAHKMVGADASEHIYPLDSSKVLRGVYKLDASNNIYCDGDTYESSGAVTRRYRTMTLDGVNARFSGVWGATDSGYVVYATIAGWTRNHNCVCDRFADSNASWGQMPLYSFVGSSGAPSTISFVLPSTVTSLAQANEWLQNNPTTIVYYYATPTTETAEPFTNPQIVDPEGTEQYVDYGYTQGTRDVAVPVGHTTEYYLDMAKKLVQLPNAAGSDGKYIIQQTNSQMELVAQPFPELTTPLTRTIVLDGTESWTLGSTYNNVQRFDLAGSYKVYTDADHQCGVATVSKGTWIQDSTFAGITDLSLCFNYGIVPATRLYVFVPRSEGITTVSAFQSWLAAENITIEYSTYGTYALTATINNAVTTYAWALSD